MSHSREFLNLRGKWVMGISKFIASWSEVMGLGIGIRRSGVRTTCEVCATSRQYEKWTELFGIRLVQKIWTICCWCGTPPPHTYLVSEVLWIKIPWGRGGKVRTIEPVSWRTSSSYISISLAERKAQGRRVNISQPHHGRSDWPLQFLMNNFCPAPCCRPDWCTQRENGHFPHSLLQGLRKKTQFPTESTQGGFYGTHKVTLILGTCVFFYFL